MKKIGAFQELLSTTQAKGKVVFNNPSDLKEFNDFIQKVKTESAVKKQKSQAAAASLFFNR